MHGIDLSNHHVTKSSNEMQKICNSLDQLNIQSFTYIKIHNDDSREILTTNAEWINYFYKNALFNEAEIVEIEHFISVDYFLWSELSSPHIAYSIGKELFNLRSGITFVVKNRDYRILYIFASDKDDSAMNGFYFRNLDIFKMFIQYFHNEANHLIKESLKYRIYLPNKRIIKPQSEPLVSREVGQSLKDNLKKQMLIDKYYLLEEDIYLTKQEMKCIKLYVGGYSINQIAEKMDINYRTVGNYIQNVKTKLNCHYDKQRLYRKVASIPSFF